MKKIGLTVLSLLLAVCLFSACGQGGNVSPDVEPQAPIADDVNYDDILTIHKFLTDGLGLIDAQFALDESMWAVSGYGDNDDVSEPFAFYDSTGVADALDKGVSSLAGALPAGTMSGDPNIPPLLNDCYDTYSALADLMINPTGSHTDFVARYDDARAAFIDDYDVLTDYLHSVNALSE